MTPLLDLVGEPPVKPQRRSWSLEEFHALIANGWFADEQIELIEGELWAMSPQAPRHARHIARLLRYLGALYDRLAWVRCQLPLTLDRSEPIPDLSIVRGDLEAYASHPGADDVLLVVEVVDSSWQYERERKLPLYARHGIMEVWLVMVATQSLWVYRDPLPEGRYTWQQTFTLGETLTPVAAELQGETVQVSRFFDP